jgi:hypothetical protein
MPIFDGYGAWNEYIPPKVGFFLNPEGVWNNQYWYFMVANDPTFLVGVGQVWGTRNDNQVLGVYPSANSWNALVPINPTGNQVGPGAIMENSIGFATEARAYCMLGNFSAVPAFTRAGTYLTPVVGGALVPGWWTEQFLGSARFSLPMLIEQLEGQAVFGDEKYIDMSIGDWGKFLSFTATPISDEEYDERQLEGKEDTTPPVVDEPLKSSVQQIAEGETENDQ